MRKIVTADVIGRVSLSLTPGALYLVDTEPGGRVTLQPVGAVLSVDAANDLMLHPAGVARILARAQTIRNISLTLLE